MDKSIEFYLGISREMKELKCSEMYIGVDDMSELIARLLQAERDAARYRWLRSCDTAESKRFVSKSGGWIVGLGVLDGMIDEAMQCK